MNKQLEFKGKGWKPKAFDRDAALQGLLDIARSYIPAASVHVDATENRELWHRSRVKWETGIDKVQGPVNMEVYYHSMEVLLPVLAHECGHLKTMASMGGIAYYQGSAMNKYKCEYIASRWALGYLRHAGMSIKDLHASEALLQGCLDNYRATCGEYSPAVLQAARLVLDYKDSPAYMAGEKAGV